MLSPKPLPAHESARLTSASGQTEFFDLGSLALGGVKSILQLRRSTEAKEIVVTAGSRRERVAFDDLLGILARILPANTRLVDQRDDGLSPVAKNLAASLARLGLNTIRGFLSLFLNSWNARRLSAVASRSFARRELNRCLYLQPTVLFGEQVGGSVGHVAGVANALARRGHFLRLVAMFEQPLLDSRIHLDVREPSFPAVFPNELNRHLYHRFFAREALRVASEFRPSYLYVRYSLSDMTGPVLRRKLGIPFILEYNGSEIWTQRHWGQTLRFESASRNIEEANLRVADLVVVVSEEIRKQVLSLGIPEERVLFYPNCVDADVFDAARFSTESRNEVRTRIGLSKEARLYTFVGTFGRWHGTDVLAQAIRCLIDRHRAWLTSHQIHFLFVGDGHLAPKVRETLGPEAQGQFVTLAGYRPQAETAGILAASDVLLSPHVPNPDGSPFFGSPTKLFEYMAMGKPIIASDLGQIGQVLRGWEPDYPNQALKDPGAILVTPGDVEDLTRAVFRVETMTPAQLEELGKRARSFVLRSFTWDQNVAAVLARLNRLVASSAEADSYLRTEETNG